MLVYVIPNSSIDDEVIARLETATEKGRGTKCLVHNHIVTFILSKLPKN